MKRAERIEKFVQEIWEWYAVHKRSLPWRDLWDLSEANRAYRVLVSEVMLQQTQVSRVTVIYKRFLDEFPTLQDLACATNRDVIMAWRGMGYNSRALRLRDSAKMIVARTKMRNAKSEMRNKSENRNSKSMFPSDMGELMKLPGIGHYTAGAIRNFAFGIPTPCLDTNIRRVLHAKFVGPPNADGTLKKDDVYLLKLAGEVLEVALSSSEEPRATRGAMSREASQLALRARSRKVAEWHHALMDYGALALPKVKLRRRELKREPGRLVGSTYIPNRIFRGKIVEELRDAEKGLPLDEIGRKVCVDWKLSEHKHWLTELMRKLEQDALISKSGKRYALQ